MNVGGDVTRALDGLETGAMLRPVLAAAQAELESGQAEACVQRLVALGNDPGSAALYLLGLAHARLGDLYRAAAAFEAAIEGAPRLHRAFLALAQIYEQQRDPARTAAVLRRALQLRPKDPAAIAALARSYNTADRPRRAEALARRGLELCPGAPILKKALADALRRQDRHREAADLLEGVVSEDADAASLVGLGRCLLAIARPQDARSLFEKVLRHDSESVGALAGMAEALEAGGRLSEARGYILRALAAAPDLPRMYVLSARIHLADGRAEAAERAALMALRMAPDNDEASRLAIRAARARLRWAEAADYAEPLLSRCPDDAQGLAAVFVQQLLDDGEPRAVLQQLERRLGQAAADPELHFAAGLAHVLLDELDAAVERLDTVRQLHEGHPLAGLLRQLALHDDRTPEQRAMGALALLRTGDASGTARPGSDPLPALGVEPAVSEIIEQTASPNPVPPPLFEPSSIHPSAPPRGAPEPSRLDGVARGQGALLDQLAELRCVLDARIGERHAVRVSDLVARVDHLVEAHDQPVTVALLGPAGAGRTSLLNALAGREALPEGSRVPHVLRYGRTPVGRVIHPDSTVETHPLASLQTVLNTAPGPVRRVEVLAPVQELTQVNLIDRPDATERTPDAALWIVGADQPLEAWDEAAAWLSRTPITALAIISRIDAVSPQVVQQRLADVRARIGEHVAGVVAFSARAGMAGLANKNLELLRASGFPALSSLLRTAVIDRADAIRSQSIARRAEHVRREALDRVERGLEAMADRAAAVGALAGRLTVDRARLRHDAKHQLPEQLGRALRGVLEARARELDSLRAADITQRVQRIKTFRDRLTRGCTQAVDAVCAELDQQLQTLLVGYFEVLDQVFPADGDPTEAARLNGLRAVLDGYRALLIEETFGRHRAYLEGWLAQAPILRWVSSTEVADPVMGLFSRGLNFDQLPPLDVDGLGSALFDGLAAFVDTTATALRAGRVALSQQLVEPLTALAQAH